LAREHFRTNNLPFNGVDLAEKEGHYSEMGNSYIATIKSIIHSNKLHQFDDIVLLKMNSFYLHVER